MEAENKQTNVKKRRITAAIVIVLVLAFIALLIPRTLHANDGGTRVFKAVLYTVYKWHAFDDPDETTGEQRYIVGTSVDILGMRVFEYTRSALESELENR